MDEFKFYGDPRTQAGWVDGPCEKQDILRFKNRYENKEAIKCNIARCGTPHKNGFTAFTHNGALKLVGIDCGKKMLGNDAFNRLTNKLANEERIAGIKKRIHNEAFDPAKALAGLRSWKPMIDRAVECQRALRSASVRVWKRLSDVALTQDGSLYVESQIRNWAAEEDRARRGKDGDPIYTFQRKFFYKMAGPEFFHTFDVSHHFSMDVETLEAMVRDLTAEASKKIKEPRLVEIAKEAERIAHHMVRMANVVDGMRAFAQPENLSKVSQWINRQTGLGVTASVSGTTLILGGESISFAGPKQCDRECISALVTRANP